MPLQHVHQIGQRYAEGGTGDDHILTYNTFGGPHTTCCCSTCAAVANATYGLEQSKYCFSNLSHASFT